MPRSRPAESRPRYPAFLRHAHWVSVVLVVLAYAAINARKLFERGSPERLFAAESHFLLGMLILLITLPRIWVRLRQKAPPITPPLSPAARLASHTAHIALFLFLAVMPLLGIAGRMVTGKGIGLPLTTWAIPAIGPLDEDFGEAIIEVHEWIGVAFYYVVGLHVLAALWHWWFRRDDTLQRML